MNVKILAISSLVALICCTFVRDVSCTRMKTKASSTATTPPPLNITTSQKPEIPCVLRNNSCKDCIGSDSCFYCESDSACHDKSKIIPTKCSGNKWYWKQCTISGMVLIIVIPTIAGVLLIMLGCCVYCCCCRSRGRNGAVREEARQRQNRQDRQQRNEERRTTRQARHDAIRMKYGLLQNDDDDDDDAVA